LPRVGEMKGEVLFAKLQYILQETLGQHKC
jgi:hypothetical protein